MKQVISIVLLVFMVGCSTMYIQEIPMPDDTMRKKVDASHTNVITGGSKMAWEFKCNKEGEECQQVGDKKTMPESSFLEKASGLGSAAIIGDGLKGSGDNINVSGGNSSATAGAKAKASASSSSKSGGKKHYNHR